MLGMNCLSAFTLKNTITVPVRELLSQVDNDLVHTQEDLVKLPVDDIGVRYPRRRLEKVVGTKSH